ncbi:CD48 antigen-like isoform X2 [Ascaphus truei]|uniref:CD48 antigen-like isoform X2 n=1 Tax=Ascaphus truei TaxID=8439 RepID=UPI003F596DC2
MFPWYWCLLPLICLNCAGSSSGSNKDISWINGTIGHPLLLQPSQGFPKDYSIVTLKKTGEANKKKKLLSYNVIAKKEIFNSMEARIRFNENSSSVEILKIEKEDAGMYEISIEEEVTEHVFELHLNVYEKISNSSVELIHSPQNDSCLITLNCKVQKGDGVTYSWRQDHRNLNHKSSMLDITLNRENATNSYTCRATNPVSEDYITVTPWLGCNITAVVIPRHWISVLFTALISVAAVLLCLVLIIWKCHVRRKGKRCQRVQPEPEPEPVLNAVNTIYGVIQKAQDLAPPCSETTDESHTVYALAGQMATNRNTARH